LAKAQAFTVTENHASTIFVLLQDDEQAEPVAQALQSANYKVLTWREQNALIVQFEDFAGAYMIILYLIVLGITATVVTNTLVMAVFERTREIGILAAIGMKGRGIMAQFLAEAALLATGGVIGGLIIGGAMVGLQATVFKSKLGPKLNGIINYETWVPSEKMMAPAAEFFKKYQARAGAEGVDPLGYYLNNTVRARALIAAAVKGKVRHFIFSSTAAVFHSGLFSWPSRSAKSSRLGRPVSESW